MCIRDRLWPSQQRALLWAARIAVVSRATQAGAIACEAAGKLLASRPAGSERQRAVLATVLGRTHTRCEAIRPWLLEPPLCNEELDCDGTLCQQGALTHGDWMGPIPSPDPKTLRREDPRVWSDARAVLYASFENGPLPQPLVLANARRHYAFADAGASQDCSDDALDAGASCRCTFFPQADRCKLKPNETRVRYQFCSFHVDDARHRFDDVKRACEPLGAACVWGEVACCGGLECMDGACRAKPLVDAAGGAR